MDLDSWQKRSYVANGNTPNKPAGFIQDPTNFEL